MKFRKLIFAAVTALSFGATLASSNDTASARALPGYNSSYWYNKRTVHIRKSVYAYQIKPSTFKSRSRKVLYKNTKVKVYNSANLSWVVSASKLHHKSGYVWVIKGHYNTSWLKK